MKEFKVSYNCTDGDLCHVRVDAYEKQGAEAQAKREYWDIDTIIQVTSV
jgi:hypothetical protein